MQTCLTLTSPILKEFIKCCVINVQFYSMGQNDVCQQMGLIYQGYCSSCETCITCFKQTLQQFFSDCMLHVSFKMYYYFIYKAEPSTHIPNVPDPLYKPLRSCMQFTYEYTKSHDIVFLNDSVLFISLHKHSRKPQPIIMSPLREMRVKHAEIQTLLAELRTKIHLFVCGLHAS